MGKATNFLLPICKIQLEMCGKLGHIPSVGFPICESQNWKWVKLPISYYLFAKFNLRWLTNQGSTVSWFSYFWKLKLEMGKATHFLLPICKIQLEIGNNTYYLLPTVKKQNW